jgi:gas vesicle protein
MPLVIGGLKMERRNQIIMGLALGMLVGSIASLMLAPQSSKESHEVLIGQMERIRGRVRRNRGARDWEEAMSTGDGDYPR